MKLKNLMYIILYHLKTLENLQSLNQGLEPAAILTVSDFGFPEGVYILSVVLTGFKNLKMSFQF